MFLKNPLSIYYCFGNFTVTILSCESLSMLFILKLKTKQFLSDSGSIKVVFVILNSEFLTLSDTENCTAFGERLYTKLMMEQKFEMIRGNYELNRLTGGVKIFLLSLTVSNNVRTS